jgi:hypothetical protein
MEDLIHIQKTFEKLFYREAIIGNEDCNAKTVFSNSDFSNNTLWIASLSIAIYHPKLLGTS